MSNHKRTKLLSFDVRRARAKKIRIHHHRPSSAWDYGGEDTEMDTTEATSPVRLALPAPAPIVDESSMALVVFQPQPHATQQIPVVSVNELLGKLLQDLSILNERQNNSNVVVTLAGAQKQLEQNREELREKEALLDEMMVVQANVHLCISLLKEQIQYLKAEIETAETLGVTSRVIDVSHPVPIIPLIQIDD